MKMSAVTRNALSPKSRKALRCSGLIDDTSVANCSAKSATTGSSAGCPSDGNGGSDSAAAHVARTSALSASSPVGDCATSRVSMS